MLWRKIENITPRRLQLKAMHEYLWAAKPEETMMHSQEFVDHIKRNYGGFDRIKLFSLGHVVFVCVIDPERGKHVVTVVEKGTYISTFKVDLNAIYKTKAEAITEAINADRRKQADLARRERHHNRDLDVLARDLERRRREEAEAKAREEAALLNEERKKQALAAYQREQFNKEQRKKKQREAQQEAERLNKELRTRRD